MKAVVLCAGYGTRLGSLTHTVPKPMLLLQGKPLLAYTLHYLAGQNFRQIAINLHFMPEKILNFVGDGSRFGVRIHYSYEPELLGTAGAIKRLEQWLSDEEDFLTIYGDLLIDQDLGPVVNYHKEKKAVATLLLHQRPGSNSLVQMDDAGRIIGFIERPTEEERIANPFLWVNSGLYVLNRRILDNIAPGRPVDFPRDVFRTIVGKEAVYGFPLTGYRCAIDSLDRYAEANRAIVEGRYKLPPGMVLNEPEGGFFR